MARQELMKQAPPTHAADLAATVAKRKTQLGAAMQRRENEAVSSLTLELKQLEAELKHVGAGNTAEVEPIKASIQFEMWYLGCLLYQLSTEDGTMVWDANQSDNIDDEQVRQLAYQWADVKAAKMKKVVWPQAAHLASLLLSEHAHSRPKTWDQVLQHPFIASEGAAPARKRIVMSCPEMGTLKQDGGPPYDQRVMDKVSQLQQIGFVKLGFDRAGTSTARKKDEKLFEEASALRDDGKPDEANALLKTTDWWYGYTTSVKGAAKLEAQGYDGVLEIICIRGGVITQLEAAEMEQIMTEATSDCAKSGIAVRFQITEVAYFDLLSEFDPASMEGHDARQLEPEPEPAESSATDDVRHGDSAGVPSATTQADPASEQGDALLAQLALKDEAIAQAQAAVAEKDAALAAAVAEKDAALGAEKAEKDAALAEVAELRAQLSRLEGVPPPMQAGR